MFEVGERVGLEKGFGEKRVARTLVGNCVDEKVMKKKGCNIGKIISWVNQANIMFSVSR